MVLLSLVYAASTSSVAFSSYNGNWEGASGLERSATEVGATPEIALDVDEYESVGADGTLALVLSPEQSYTEAELEKLREFVESGGTLVVAEDFGPNGNRVLAGVGADARFDGRLVRDERSYARSPSMPVVSPVGNTSLVSGELVFNYGTAVVPNGATVVAATSDLSYLDSDGDQSLDGDEPVRSYPAVTVETVGEGTVVTLGDPSLVINSMQTYPGNAAFVDELFSRHDTIVLDQSHAGSVPPLGRALVLVRDFPALQVALGLAAVVLLAFVERHALRRLRARLSRRLRSRLARRLRSRGRSRSSRGPAVDRGSGPSREALVAHLTRRYPRLEAERVERVVSVFLQARGDDSEEATPD